MKRVQAFKPVILGFKDIT